MELLYQNLDIHLYKLKSPIVVSDANPDGVATQIGNLAVITKELVDSPEATSGFITGNLEYTGGYIQSANFVSGTSGWKLDSSGTLTAVSATISGTITATAGTIGGWTIGSTTISSATSGERIILDQGNKKLELFNSSGTSVVILSYGTLTGDAALTVEQANDNRTGIKITTNSGITGNHSLYVSNLANDANSQGIYIGRSGSSASTIFGLAVSSSNSGAGGATAGDFSAPTGIRITGATVWGLNLSTTGGGITMAQTGSSDSYTLFADNDSSSINSYCAWFDRDLNTTGTAYSTIITCDNTNGNATALDVKATPAGGSTGIDIRCTGAGIGIQLTSQAKVFKFTADATAAGSYAGRVPIDVDGNLRYIHYYNA